MKSVAIVTPRVPVLLVSWVLCVLPAAAPMNPVPVSTLNSNAVTDIESDAFPSIATDGNGHWLAVWHTSDHAGGIGPDGDIIISRSVNNGQSWSNAVPLNTNAFSDSGGDGFANVATDGIGNWVAVWQSDDNLGVPMVTENDIFVSRSSDAGLTWSPPARISIVTGSVDNEADTRPEIVTDSSGTWIAVWECESKVLGPNGQDIDIFVARSADNGASWSTPLALNTNSAADAGDDVAVHLATDGLGNWVAAWSSNDTLGGTIGADFDILVSRTSDGGITWSAPAGLNTTAASDTGPDVSPHISTDENGLWVAVWQCVVTLSDDFDICTSQSVDNGASWSAVAQLNTNAPTDAGYDQGPAVSVDSDGNWIAVWQSNSLKELLGSNPDILAALSTDNGVSWTDPNPLNADRDSDDVTFDDPPEVATDGATTWIVVWPANRSMGGPSETDSEILYAAFTLASPGAPTADLVAIAATTLGVLLGAAVLLARTK